MNVPANILLAAEEQPELDWSMIWSTVITGIVVVFLILIILIIFLIVFGKIFKSINESQDKRAARKLIDNSAKSFRLQTPSNTPPPPSPAPADDTSGEEEYEEEDDSEIIAVIAAAIAAYGEAEGKQYRIASVKRSKTRRSGWSSAGIADNTRGFIN